MPDPITPPVDYWSKRFNAYGAMFVTVAVFTLLAAGMGISVWEKDTQLFNGLMETVKALVMVAAGYWIGSSNSSQRKDETISQQSAALAVSMPPVT
jgi:hypothetical protein